MNKNPNYNLIHQSKIDISNILLLEYLRKKNISTLAILLLIKRSKLSMVSNLGVF